MTDRPGFIFTEPSDERQYVTMGWFMQQTGLPFRTLRDAMDEIGLRPDFKLNNIKYFSMLHAWPKLYCHLLNSGLIQSELHVPCEKAQIDPKD